MNYHKFVLFYIVIFCCFCQKAEGQFSKTQQEYSYGIAMHGTPKFKNEDDIKLEYVNSEAPKKGTLNHSFVGTFDSLNPYIVRGTPSTFIRGYVVESLMTRALDEPFTLYGLIASAVFLPDDRGEITFKINPKAQFSDTQPITSSDVIASFMFLKNMGRPNYRSSFQKVENTEIIDSHTVKFIFPNAKDRELPLILGLMPIFPKKLLDTNQLETTTLSAYTGSGPYKISDVKQGQLLTLKRNSNYWGRNLPIQRGIYNFDEIRIEYFRDTNTAFEAFKNKNIDFRYEDDATRWIKSYNFESALKQSVLKKEVMSGAPKPMHGFVFNTRRPPFDNLHVRQAITELYNFEWVNANLYGNAFTRTSSYFEGSTLSALHAPATSFELSMLSKLGVNLPEAILNGTYTSPKLSLSGRDRSAKLRALNLLKLADYELKNQTLIHTKTGFPLNFELIILSKDQEKNALTFQNMLSQIGITLKVRLVDSAQFERRRQNFEFDMIPFSYPSSLSPGNEQVFRWASKNANLKGSFNLAGVKSNAIDTVIQTMLSANNNEEFVQSVRTLDRLLISGHYVMPLYHSKGQWIAHWDTIAMPDKFPLLGFSPEVMWFSQDKPYSLSN